MRISIVGCGHLGVKVAGELYLKGHCVALHDNSKSKLTNAKKLIETEIKNHFPNCLPPISKKGILLYFDDLSHAVQNSMLILECICEDLNKKQAVLKEIEELCSEGAVITSSSISLDINQVFHLTKNPQRFLGLRFIYPVFFIPLVEATTTSFTSPSTLQYVEDVMAKMDKRVVMRKESFCLQVTQQEAEEYKQDFLNKLASLPPLPSPPPSTPILSSSVSSPFLQESSSPPPPPQSSTPSPPPPQSSTPPPPPLTHHSRNSTPLKLKMTQGDQESSPRDNYGCSPSVLRECVICMEGDRDTLLRPCNHLITCNPCSWKLISKQSDCPICRSEIKEVLHVFRS